MAHQDYEVLRSRTLPYSYLHRLQTGVQLTCDVQLSLLLTAFIWTYTKIIYTNSVVILRAHNLSSFRQEIIWFSEATGHMMERHIWYKAAVVYLAIQYESLSLYDSLESLNFSEFPFHMQQINTISKSKSLFYMWPHHTYWTPYIQKIFQHS